jgi:hypothetical protein
MLFHFIFDFLFGLVQIGGSHFAGHGYPWGRKAPDFRPGI